MGKVKTILINKALEDGALPVVRYEVTIADSSISVLAFNKVSVAPLTCPNPANPPPPKYNNGLSIL